MAQLTIELESQLLAAMTALAQAQRRAPVEIARVAIAEYVSEHAIVRSARSVKAGAAGASVSVSAGARPSVLLLERKRLSDLTSGIWKDRQVDGLQY